MLLNVWVFFIHIYGKYLLHSKTFTGYIKNLKFKPLIESYDCVEAVNKCQTSAEMHFELFSLVPVHDYQAILTPQTRSIQPQFWQNDITFNKLFTVDKYV